MGVDTTSSWASADHFWQKCSECLRAQLIELQDAQTLEDLARLWGFGHVEEVRRYMWGPLRRRMEREGVVELLRMCIQ